MAKTIIVSNRLPIRIEKQDGEKVYKTSEGGLATGLGSIYKEGNNIWIGWPGISLDHEEEKEVEKELMNRNMRPVFLTEHDVKEFYLGFSNQTLWPAFHYFIHHMRFVDEEWEAYYNANRKFADAISKWLEPDDIIWVHDYQLMLVPEMLRKQFPNVTIGFFQHIPFPSYEVFRMIPWRKKLLNGVLGADYIGFHTYDDMRHFLSSCHRLASYSYERNQILVKNRLVEADSLPMGIDFDKYLESAKSQLAKAKEISYRDSLGKQELILSMDRLDYSKGIPGRLQAFDKFLEKYPEYQGRVSLFLIVVPSRDQVASYKALKEKVEFLVGHVNGKYGTINYIPVHFYYRSFPLDDLSAFYRMCKIAMITPKRDGMNLVCKEFIASRENEDGVLILSEMAGASKELSDAILVNPNDQNEMVDAIKKALEMPLAEQKRRMKIMQKTVKKYTIFQWVDLFMSNLKDLKERQRSMSTKKLDNKIKSRITKEFKSAKNPLIFLDYDGTLMPFKENPEDCAPDVELSQILHQLAVKAKLVVISGRKADTLEEWLDEFNIDLIAEHGIKTKRAGAKWEVNGDLQDNGWKKEARDILEFYIQRTPGSFLEEKEHTLVWHYRKVEKGLGSLRSSELSSHLKHFMTNKGLDVIEGDHVVEVKPSVINKGKAAIERLKGENADFIMAFGDDRTDEDTFEALPKTALTVKVGSGFSFAKYAVENNEEVRALLKTFVNE
ncbi:bifunctional alpha,alpha-trehalose-phosphate synthase (UDP-forming)/trehalose-phosphatase [Marivirga sp.]|uniref:bifunctional alpha,alpha-trehalose-phosphate synthase (UDP-forming)/trehalose-phosphatase n=1 Tax=Marivirga sp. TaxID=2018662 RepID=UPI002D7E3A89|nr:bifunctional alpha,alpha-trehalose-phosphate synthase (UDP-forming)/trehalose-phosphatase [Marivirga sp.]HET8860241.1 bifunctional alpha,alpha-trehalose-phosphate synthase (UDP-forming)/trehalose-phosphatase [Marivirga sp.]